MRLMRNTSLLVLSLAVLSVLSVRRAAAQSVDEIKGGGYYYGEGISATGYHEAKKAALNDLVGQFQQQVSAWTRLAEKDGSVTYASEVVATSDVYLTGLGEIRSEDGKGDKRVWKVTLYISKEEIADRAAGKMADILRTVSRGDTLLSSGDITGALRLYHEAFVLTASDWMLCNARNLDESGYFVSDFKRKLDDVLAGIDFRVGAKPVAFASFSVVPTYKGKYAPGLRYEALIDGEWAEKMGDTLVTYQEHIPDTLELRVTVDDLSMSHLTDEEAHNVSRMRTVAFADTWSKVLPPHGQIQQIRAVAGERGYIHVFMADPNDVGRVVCGNQFVGRTPITFETSTGITRVIVQKESTGHTEEYKVGVVKNAITMLLVK